MYFWKCISIIRNAGSSAAFPNSGTAGISGCVASLQAGKQNGQRAPALLITRVLAGTEEGGLLFLPGLFSPEQPPWRAETPLVPPVPGSRRELMLLWHCKRSVMNTSLSVLLFGQGASRGHWLRPNDTYNWGMQQLKGDMIAERHITQCAFLTANYHRCKGFAPALKPTSISFTQM